MSHNKKKHKRIVRKRKAKEKRKVKRASFDASVSNGVVKDVATKMTKRYETVFSDEITPYSDYLRKYGVREGRVAIRMTDNPAEPSNFISKWEIFLTLKEENEGEEYLYIPSKPLKTKKKEVLKFLSERGLSHYVNFEMAEEAMKKTYARLVSSYGLDVAINFFKQRGCYLVEMRYDENAGFFLPTDSSGHFDLVREPDFDYKKYITDNYREIGIQWQGKD